MIYSLKLGEREIFLSETEPLGVLSSSESGTADVYQEMEVLGAPVKVGIGKKAVFPDSQRNYALILSVARAVGLAFGGAPLEAAVILSKGGSVAVRLGIFAVSELLSEERTLNLSLEGAKAFEYEGVLREEFERVLKEREIDLRELLKNGYYTRVAGDGHGEIYPEDVSAGEPVFVVREENPNHRLAVKFLTRDGRKIGYMRREVADLVAPLMDEGLFLKGEVVQIFPENPANRRVYVKVVEI